MEKNFAFTNFCTIYSSKGNTPNNLRERACFSDIFYSEYNGVVQKNTYEVTLYKLGDTLNKERKNNACLLDKRGIIRHLKILQSVFKFSWHLKEDGDDKYILTLTLDGDLIYHKYLLTWVRYLYEFPFNVFLLDAINLKKLPEFKFESIINLFNVAGATSGINRHGCDIHAIGATYTFKQLYTIKETKSSLKSLEGGHTRLNNTFLYVEDEDNLKQFNKTLKDNVDSLEFWSSDEWFTKRLPLYKENYKILKKLQAK
jgi:hypothetical protein